MRHGRPVFFRNNHRDTEIFISELPRLRGTMLIRLRGANKMKRRKIGRSKSRKMFTKGASKTHRKNIQRRPMRGGLRL